MDDEYECARLEASLGLHQAKIETLRQLERRLDARIARLGDLSLAAKQLIDSILLNPFEVPLEVPLEARKDFKKPLGRSVSWMKEHEEVTLKSEAQQFPAHGHWVPLDVLERRASFQGEAAKKLGGRQVKLSVGDRSVPFILVEPMGKHINKDFLSTGVAIILGSNLDEWAQVLKRTKLLDAGISVAIFMESELAELADVDLVDAIMSMYADELCILCGKGLGAQRVMEFTHERLCGAILFAPSDAPKWAPNAKSFEGPVMLVFPRDAENFDSAQLWAEALAQRDAVAVLRDPPGGQDLSRVLRKDERCAQERKQITCHWPSINVDLSILYTV